MECAILHPSVVCTSARVWASMARMRTARGENGKYLVMLQKSLFGHDPRESIVIESHDYFLRDKAVAKFQKLFDDPANDDKVIMMVHFDDTVETRWRRPPKKVL